MTPNLTTTGHHGPVAEYRDRPILLFTNGYGHLTFSYNTGTTWLEHTYILYPYNEAINRFINLITKELSHD